MRFSIIVPIYNNKEYLARCFDSILSQTYTDYEVLLVNDMSTDGNEEIINEYIKKFEKKCKGCKLFNNKSKRLNGGSRNVAIVEAKGEYVFSIDCDDYLIDNKVLEDINNNLNDVDVMFLGYNVYTSEDNNFDLVPNYNTIEEALKGCSCALWTRVVKTELLKQVLYKEGTLFEDLGHHIRLCLKMKSFNCLGRVTHIWNRQNINSISKNSTYEWYRFNFCEEMYEIIRTLDDEHLYLRDYLIGILKDYMSKCNKMVEEL